MRARDDDRILVLGEIPENDDHFGPPPDDPLDTLRMLRVELAQLEGFDLEAVSGETAARLVSDLDDVVKRVRRLAGDAEAALIGELDERTNMGMRIFGANTDRPLLAKLTRRKVRRKIEAEALANEIIRRATTSVEADPVTGEIRDPHIAALAEVRRCFRLVPRWGTIRKFGLNEDEFCEQDWVTSVKLQPYESGRLES